MAIPYNLREIDNMLASLKTKDEKLIYLSDYLFEKKKKRAEMEFDKIDLSRLTEKTKNDYEKYHNEFDEGRLVNFSNDKWEAISTKRIGFENIELLKKRIALENSFKMIDGDILLFEGLIEKIKNTTPDQNQQIKNLATLKEHWEPLWPLIKKEVEKRKNPLVKINYLKDKYHDYMEEVISTPTLFHSSGDYIDHSKPQKIGMDALIEEEIRHIETKYGIKHNGVQPKTIKPNNSFKFNNSDAIESIFNRLKKDNYLTDAITLPLFKRVFNEVKLIQVSPINWQGSIASLRYFIKLFPIEITNLKRWHITEHCFTCDGKKINIKQLESAKQISTKDKEQLNEIAKLYLTQK